MLQPLSIGFSIDVLIRHHPCFHLIGFVPPQGEDGLAGGQFYKTI
jgi:hypothetical protein